MVGATLTGPDTDRLRRLRAIRGGQSIGSAAFDAGV